MHSSPYSPAGDVVAQAAIRRATFMRDEVESGRVPAGHPLGREYLDQADRLELLYPDEAARANELARREEINELDRLFYTDD